MWGDGTAFVIFLEMFEKMGFSEVLWGCYQMPLLNILSGRGYRATGKPAIPVFFWVF